MAVQRPKSRLIFYARLVNAFLRYKKFRYERLTDLLTHATPGGS